MQRISVTSSNVASLWYDAKTSTLEIEFNHGWVYQYFDVEQEVYDELMSADSHGKYFIANIKDCYAYEKVR